MMVRKLCTVWSVIGATGDQIGGLLLSNFGVKTMDHFVFGYILCKDIGVGVEGGVIMEVRLSSLVVVVMLSGLLT